MRRPSLLALALLAACDAGADRPTTTSGGVRQEPYVAIPPGTAPRGTMSFIEALAPPGPPVTPALLAQGREGYAIYCTPCHGRRGEGDGPVVQRGFPRPASFHAQHSYGAEHVVGVITNGYGRMYPYAERIPPAQRWAIARYVETLQEPAR